MADSYVHGNEPSGSINMTNLLTNETMTDVSRKAMLHGVSVDLCTRIAGLISPSRMDTNTVSVQVGYEQKCHFFLTLRLEQTEGLKCLTRTEKIPVNSKTFVKGELTMLCATAFTHHRFCVQHEETVSR